MSVLCYHSLAIANLLIPAMFDKFSLSDILLINERAVYILSNGKMYPGELILSLTSKNIFFMTLPA